MIVDNRNEVRDFLVSRRARITPGQAGLRAYGGNRRVPGLRREEVALLAGVREQIDASLARLNTDYVDLYQIHRFDPETPVEETMEALHDVVKAGKARYIGASSMWAWQFSKMQYVADLHGWTRFVSMQDQYNLMQREEEHEMFGLLADQGVGSIPYTPLAKGRLARPWGDAALRRRSSRATIRH